MAHLVSFSSRPFEFPTSLDLHYFSSYLRGSIARVLTLLIFVLLVMGLHMLENISNNNKERIVQ